MYRKLGVHEISDIANRFEEVLHHKTDYNKKEYSSALMELLK